MIRAGLLVLLVLSGAAALAQGVPVRSGAHERFDRLVIDLPRRHDWRIEPHEGGVAVVFEERALRFDLGAVFSRIGQARLRAIAAPQGQGRLVLDLACDCPVRPFWHGAAMLVLDISDPVHPPDASMASRRPTALAVLPDAPVSPATEAIAARLAPALAVDAVPDGDVDTAPQGDLGQMRAVLLRQLGRAASQGLVSAAPDTSPPPPLGPASPSPQPANDSPPDPPAADPDGHLALRAVTSMDRDVGARPSGGAPDPVAGCPLPGRLDVASWGGPQGLHAGIGRLHRGLYGEFDRVDPTVARDLARFYIHHGFGAEARQSLGLTSGGDREIRLLRDLALVVDQQPLPASTDLRGFAGCGEPGVLWALLAAEQIDETLVFDHRALQRSFAALPDGLRRALGPGLARRLAAVGHLETADHLQRMVARVAMPGDPAAGLVRADLSARANPPDPATLETVRRSNSAHAAEALALTIEADLARGAPVALEQAQLAGAFAQELRGTSMGDRLAVAHVAALASSGAFAEAVAARERLAPDPALPPATTMAESILWQATDKADDITFLRHALAERLVPAGSVTASLAAGIARRLLDQGFAEAADRYLGGAPTDPALRLLRAEIALALQRPAEAELALLAMQGGLADQLRARARVLHGDHAAARRLFAASDAMSEADRAALFARDPSALTQAADPLMHDLARVLDGPKSRSGDDPGMRLGQQRDLLAESGAARETLSRLLAASPLPE
ncbi:hypothetical protein [Roseovarius autotrophicus]|uniref:hypothetical protein n=1 Tax=Roseovarius autotrophicus TaxID=2824121 RepID=UPI001B37001A|nr:hypothetical protein [Roseovarius autotrophicus]